MADPLRISDAASLALHAAVLLSARPERRMAVNEMAARLHVSQAHLSKVLQRLAKVGLVRSTRGPRGGFVLDKPTGQVTLLEVYEAVEGPLSATHCLLGLQVCGARRCLLGDLGQVVSARVRDYLGTTRLSEVSDVLERAS